MEVDEFLERSLQAVVSHLRFDRAMVLLADERRGVLMRPQRRRHARDGADGDRAGAGAGPSDVAARGALPRRRSDALPRRRDQIPTKATGTAAALGVTLSFLGTPLAAKGLHARASWPSTTGCRAARWSRATAAAVHGRQPDRQRGRECPPVRGDRGPQPRARAARRGADRGACAGDRRGTAARAAATAVRTKSAFPTNVSHELRTPPTSVVGFSKIISRRLDDLVFPAVEATDPKIQRDAPDRREPGDHLDRRASA